MIPFDPRRRFLEAARADPAGPYATDLLGYDESRLFKNADVLLHAREGHVEPVGEGGDRGVLTAELLEYTTSRGVRQRGKSGVEVRLRILNHMVQCLSCAGDGPQAPALDRGCSCAGRGCASQLPTEPRVLTEGSSLVVGDREAAGLIERHDLMPVR